MFILCPIIAAVVLVFLGYLALWTSGQANTPKGVSQFGRILAIVLFVIAAVALILCSTCRSNMGRSCMMGQMGMMGKGNMHGYMGREHMGMKGMDKMQCPAEKGKKGGFSKQAPEDTEEK
jgi:hypothetical protein